MSPIPVKTVFFDAVGTLFHVKGSVGTIYLHYAQKYGVDDSLNMEEAINSAFRDVFQKVPPPIFSVQGPEKLKQCERLWWFDVVHAVFYRVGMFEGFDEYFDEVFEAFESARHWDIYPETVGVLTELKRMGFELGVISNFDTRFFQIIRALELSHFFDTLTISSLAGAAKPSPRIFQYALDQHCVLPQEAVHVGDHEQEDFQGALGAGLHAFHVDRAQKKAWGNGVFPDLRDLPRHLTLEK
ncbi:MAG: HAD-IA family hydrolase [Nitrospirales bacterium]